MGRRAEAFARACCLLLQDYAAALVAFATTDAFPGGELVERHGGALRFHLPATSEPLSALFSHIEQARACLHIQSYSLGQTTLEQVCRARCTGLHPILKPFTPPPPPPGFHGLRFAARGRKGRCTWDADLMCPSGLGGCARHGRSSWALGERHLHATASELAVLLAL